MQIAIINDTHCGVKNGSDVFLKNAEQFYTNVFFPYLEKHNIKTQIIDIQDLEADNPGTYVFFGKLKEKNLRDMNEAVNLAKRGGRRVDSNNLWLNATFEDDTGPIISTVDRFKYNKLGKPIVEDGKIGDWYLIKGHLKQGFRKIYVDKWRKLT